MYSGLALLMDVYFPSKSNGHAVVCIPGSGWNMPIGYDSAPLKQRIVGVSNWRSLTDAGYTLFVINHRATSRFQYPAPVEDAPRAVRFIRAIAADPSAPSNISMSPTITSPAMTMGGVILGIRQSGALAIVNAA
jgi:acetyl esterase/lipase